MLGLAGSLTIATNTNRGNPNPMTQPQILSKTLAALKKNKGHRISTAQQLGVTTSCLLGRLARLKKLGYKIPTDTATASKFMKGEYFPTPEEFEQRREEMWQAHLAKRAGESLEATYGDGLGKPKEVALIRTFNGYLLGS